MPRQARNRAATTSLPPAILSDNLPLPTLIAFDLDYTLWPFWVDTHVTPPLNSSSPPASPGSSVTDFVGDTYKFYDDVPSILRTLKEKGILVAAASRTHAPVLAKEMLGLLRVEAPKKVPKSAVSFNDSATDEDQEEGEEDGGNAPSSDEIQKEPSQAGLAPEDGKMKALAFFDYLTIYPGNKTTHFREIAKATGVPYESMLFFDDEARNKNVESLGVTMCLVEDGVSWREFERGVREWRARNGHPGKGRV